MIAETERRNEIQKKFEKSFEDLSVKIKKEEEERLVCIQNNKETNERIDKVVNGQKLKEQQYVATIEKLELEKKLSETKLEQHVNITNEILEKVKLMEKELTDSHEREALYKKQVFLIYINSQKHIVINMVKQLN